MKMKIKMKIELKKYFFLSHLDIKIHIFLK